MGDIIKPATIAGENWKARVQEFASSEVFDRLFKEGMALVEEAAAYLDGPGRQESRALDRELALTYAAESMEVTTRLMQAASWLVVQRAVREEDMSIEEAGEEKFRLTELSPPRGSDLNALPDAVTDLISRSRSLYERVYRLDETLYSEEEVRPANPVMGHMDRIRSAAESGTFDPLSIWRDSE